VNASSLFFLLSPFSLPAPPSDPPSVWYISKFGITKKGLTTIQAAGREGKSYITSPVPVQSVPTKEKSAPSRVVSKPCLYKSIGPTPKSVAGESEKK